MSPLGWLFVVLGGVWVLWPLLDTFLHFEAYRNMVRYGLIDPRVWRL